MLRDKILAYVEENLEEVLIKYLKSPDGSRYSAEVRTDKGAEGITDDIMKIILSEFEAA